MSNFIQTLNDAWQRTNSLLCVGLDPEPSKFPGALAGRPDAIFDFCRAIVDASAPYASSFKPQIAYFAAHRAEDQLEQLIAHIHANHPDLPVILDAKRGDIGSTAARQAVALFDGLGADAITVSPYLGEEAIRPLLERGDRFAYVLCRTSNPGAGELQSLVVVADAETGQPEEPLYVRVARRAAGWGPGGTVGLVVGATAPAELETVRSVAPGLVFLVPGVGAQGGDEAAVLRSGPATELPAGGRPGGGLLVNVSRGIAAAAAVGRDGTPAADPEEAIAAAARDWAGRLGVLP
jgi:orotidine-5'-phosphate decarboxylase